MKATDLILRLHELVQEKGEADVVVMLKLGEGERAVFPVDSAAAFGLQAFGVGPVRRIIQLSANSPTPIEREANANPSH